MTNELHKLLTDLIGADESEIMKKGMMVATSDEMTYLMENATVTEFAAFLTSLITNYCIQSGNDITKLYIKLIAGFKLAKDLNEVFVNGAL